MAYHISDGQVSSGIELNYYSMYISSGGVASNTTVNYWGSMYIRNGGVASNTTVNSGGWMGIYSGGVASNTIVSSGGYVGIFGGVASNTTVSSGGSMYISRGGVANSTTVSSNGAMYISSGGVASNTTVNSSGYMYISSGGTAIAIKENGGYVDVAAGANVTFVSNTISDLVIGYYDRMTVHSNTVAINTTVSSGGRMYISSGGTATNIVASAGAILGITVTSDTYIQGTYAGSAFEMSDAKISGYTVSSDGYMVIENGGVANDTTVEYWGWMDIISGGVANNTTVNYRGSMYIGNGGVANETTVNYDGSMYISSGGVANETTVTYWGWMDIISGGVANDTTVSSGGYMVIGNGGVASNTTVNSDSYMFISSGGVASNIVASSGARLGIAVAENTYIQGTSAGSAFEMKNAQISEYTINSGGYMDICFGGVANSTTVSSGGYMHIWSGGVANNTTVSGGSMYISSGGVASNTTVSSGGYMDIYSGGVASNTTVSSGGYMDIYSGGVANSTTVNSDGDMFIFSGGTASNTTVSSGGYMYIENGGVANDTTVSSGGDMYISSGGVASNIVASSGARLGIAVAENTYIQGTSAGSAFEMKNAQISEYTINSGGYMYIENGGVANDTTVSSGGYMHIWSGGVANNTIVSSGGYVDIFGGVANDITVSSGGGITFFGNACAVTVFAGGLLGRFSFDEDKYFDNIANEKATIAPNVTVVGNSMVISNGGTVSNTTVNSSGSMTIFSGGVASNTTVNYDGYMYISSGGLANSTTVSSGGVMSIENGGVANNTTVNDGYMRISSGGVANDTTVSSGGDMDIWAGGVASNTTVSSGGWMSVDNGGVASNTTVSSGGYMSIENGGVASDTTVSSDGRVSIVSGGYATSLTLLSGGELGGFSFSEDKYFKSIINGSASVADHVYIIRNFMCIESGGVASNTTVNSGGYMYIYSGGVASNTTVSSGGSMYISYGGVANNTTVSGGGDMWIDYGGVASDTTVSSGGRVSIDGYATSLTLLSGGELGGFSFSEDKYFKSIINGSASVADHVYIIRNFMCIESGGVASNTTVNFGGDMDIWAGGVASNTTVSSGGWMSVDNGGVASNTTVSGGSMYIYSGGVASNTTVNYGGDMYISRGGVASDTTVSSGGWMIIDSGGTATNIIWTPCVGYVYVANGAYVTYASNYSGVYFGSNDQLLSSAQKMDNKVVSGSMYVMNNGVVSNTTVNSYGAMYIYSGGVANSTTMSGSAMYIYSGGVASNTTVNYWGSMNIGNGGVASNTTVNSYGAMYIYSGGVANSTTMSGGSMYISYGGVANSTTVSSGGDMYINGGVASNTTVSPGGSMYISRGGVASDTTVSSGGWMCISSGGVHRGSLQIDSGATVSAYRGAMIDFTVAGRTGADDYLINDLSLISGTPTYTITISANQATGTYKLAQGASDFSGSVTIMTIKDGTTSYGSITVNSADFVYGGKSYSLDQINGNLTLTVSAKDVTPPEKPVASANITALTNKDVVVTATFSSDTAVKQYSLNNSTWSTYSGGVAMSANGTVYFRGLDAAGNISQVASYTVSNIDKTPPTAPTVKADVTAPTNGSVYLTATFSSDSSKKEYSLDNRTWQNYSGAVKVDANATVYFRASDSVGNVSEVTRFVVSNIYTVAPTLEITGNAEAPTNQDVILSAKASDGKVEYFDGSSWIAGNKLTVTKNGTYTFRVTDEAGNVTEKSVEVTQIDKVAPTLEVTGNATAWTNKDVTLTAIVSDGTVEYFANGEWLAGDKLVVSENGTYTFRVTDEAGNITEQSVEVTQIDKVAPTLEITGNAEAPTNKDVVLSAVVSDGTVEYFANGKWLAGDKLTVSKNGTYTFRVTDLAGNVTEKSVVVDQIDKVAPTLEITGNATAPTNKDVVLSATVSDGVIEYFANGEWLAGDKLTVSENGTYTFRVTDEAGNVAEKSVEVTQIDKVAPTLEVTGNATAWTNKDVTLTAIVSDGTVEYFANGKWLAGNKLTVTENGTYQFRVTDEVGNITEKLVVVDQIDKVAPTLEITGNATAPTNQDVVLSAVVSDGIVEYFANGEWVAGDKLTVSKNGTYTFRVTDLAGNVTEKSVVVDQIDKFVPDVPLNAEPIFIKKSYSSKINGKKQSGFVLKYWENAFRYIPIDVDCSDRKVILLDSKSVFHMSIEAENLDTIYGNLETVSSQTGSYKYSKNSKNQVDFVMGDNSHINLESFATVNVTDGASIGNISGGKETVSQSEKKSLKNWVITETVKYSQTVTASGKVTVTDATAGNISGYSTVTLDNGVAGELVNSNVKISKSDKTVGGKDDTITHTTTYSASGTATLKNGSHVESIGGFKTVKLIASTAGSIALGNSYTEKYSLKNGMKTESYKDTYAGTVTLDNSTVDSIVEMSKVTVSKGFNAIGSYTGSAGNDTFTINKNAVLALGAVDMAGGTKDKFVNNGTLVLTGDFDRSFISGKGEIVAASDVYSELEIKEGVLNLGATADGFRTTKHENSDDTIKKAVKWDLKSDYTGWLGGSDSDVVDSIDCIKFTVSKKDAGMDISVSGVDSYTLFNSKGVKLGSDLSSLAAGTYTLQLTLDENSNSTSYTLALA